MDQKKLFKEDINFLECPSWVINEKNKLKQLVIEKSHGRYEMIAPLGLPTHFDRLVLYFVMYELLKDTNSESRKITTSRYVIAKHVYDKKVRSTKQFERILISLKKWQAISIHFKGIFYEGDSYKDRLFHIIEDVILDSLSKSLVIIFNEQYLLHLRNTKFYKYLDFNTYKKLKRSLSARLYELLIKTFKGRDSWSIDIQTLAEKLTLEKRSKAQTYYPSDVLTLLKPAVAEINQKTELALIFDFNKAKDMCTFTNTAKNSLQDDLTPATIEVNLNNTPEITALEEMGKNLENMLVVWGITKAKARKLVQEHAPEKIKHKIALLQANRGTIQSPAAWLVKALENNWDTATQSTSNSKRQSQAQEQPIIQTISPITQEKTKATSEELQHRHTEYLENKVRELYKQLPPKLIKIYDAQYLEWVKDKKQSPFSKYIPEHAYKTEFLKEILLEEHDLDFNLWVKEQSINFT